MKKLTAGIFATILGLTAVDAFAVQVASKNYVDVGLGTKQNVLSTEQMAAVNSGITAAKVQEFEGKQGSLSTEQMAAVNSGITADKVTAYDAYATGKQDALSTEQMAAVNSGITAAKVQEIDSLGTTYVKVSDVVIDYPTQQPQQ